MKTTILLVDDHESTRLGIRYVIEKSATDLEIVGEATNGRAALDMVSELKPDVVIMDIGMPQLNGIDATRAIKQRQPRTRVIALSIYKRQLMVANMLKAGASAYILKESISDDLLAAIRVVMADGIYLNPEINSVMAEDYLGKHLPPEASLASRSLSPREREILQLLVEGHNTKQAAEYLGLSVKTIEATRSRIMKKLNIHNLAELTKYSIRQGITTVD